MWKQTDEFTSYKIGGKSVCTSTTMTCQNSLSRLRSSNRKSCQQQGSHWTVNEQWLLDISACVCVATRDYYYDYWLHCNALLHHHLSSILHRSKYASSTQKQNILPNSNGTRNICKLKYFYIKELAKTYHTNRDVVVCGSGGSCVEDLETWNQWSVVQLA